MRALSRGAPATRAGARWLDQLPQYRYELTVPADERRTLATAWFGLSVAALVASGLFALLLVAARTPGLQAVLPGVDFFHVALVVHVDLSVLVWFVGMAGLLWTLAGSARAPMLGWLGFLLCAIGTAAMALAPFVQHGEAVMSNYVPVLGSRAFAFGLLMFGLGLAVTTLRALAAPGRIGVALPGEGALRFGLNGAAVSTAVALGALAWSWWALREVRAQGLPDKAYFEQLFWGAGHVVQFTWTLLMLVAWLWLAGRSELPVPLSPRIVLLLFGVALASVFATPVLYLAWEVGSVEHARLFTWLMRYGGGLAIVPLAAALAIGLARAPAALARDRPLRDALTASLLLFGAGGAIGFLIHGSNVKIPAHYHGCIVGVTLALMGLAYDLLPRLGFAARRTASGRSSVSELDAPLRSRSGATTVISPYARRCSASAVRPGEK